MWSLAISWHEPGQDSDFQKFGLFKNTLDAFWRLRCDILGYLRDILVEFAAIVDDDDDRFGCLSGAL